MTLNLDRIEQAARAATQGEWITDECWVSSSDELPVADAYSFQTAAYIAAVSPGHLLPLIEALKEWRDAWNAQDADQYEKARTALLALIGDDT